MNKIYQSIEEKFIVFALLFYSGSFSFSSFFIASEGLIEQSLRDNPISPLLSIIQHCIFFLTLLLLIVRWQNSLRAINRNKFIWCFILLCLFSFLWSDFADLTFRRSLSLFETTIFGLYFAVSFSLKEQIKLLSYTLIALIGVNFLFTMAMPNSGIENGIHTGAWRGVFAQKNLLARSMVLTTLILLVVSPENNQQKYFFRTAFIPAVILVILSTSKTGVLVLFLLVPLTIILLKIFRLSSISLIPLKLSLFLFIGGLFTWGVSDAENILLSLGKDPSFTGRTLLWSALVDKIQERPLLGYGYVGFWHDTEGASAYVGKVLGTTYIPPHAHNGFFELLLAFGSIGALLFGLSLLSTIRRTLIAARLTKSREGLFPLIYLSFFVVYNLTESSLVEHNSIFWIIYVALASSRFIPMSELYPNSCNQKNFTPHTIKETN